MQNHRAVCILHFALGISLLSACAQQNLNLPTARGPALSNAAAVHADVAKGCAGVRTLTAELALAGRAGSQRISGRALVGFESPDSMRLEGLAPIGQPAFILAARRGTAILWLPRDERVLRDASADEILGALTGVALAPADLLAILTGCVTPSPTVTGGFEQGGWLVLELEGGAALYLRRAGDALQLRAARRDNWQIEYADWEGDFPRTVRLVSRGTPPVDMTARLSQVEANIDLDQKAFTVDVPDDAAPITLDELRDAGPLRGTTASP